MDDVPASISGGVVATIVMLGIFYGVAAMTGYAFRAPEVMATLINAPEILGLIVFVGAGMVLWPLLFVAFGWRLPGTTEATSGVVLAVILWVAFAVGFSQGLGREDLVAFVVVGLVAHLVYGGLLGTIYRRLGEHRQVPA